MREREREASVFEWRTRRLNKNEGLFEQRLLFVLLIFYLDFVPCLLYIASCETIKVEAVSCCCLPIRIVIFFIWFTFC